MNGLSRRGFLATGAAAVAAAPLWAEAGAPRYLTAANRDQATFLLGLAADGAARFRIAIPSRGHAACAHPQRAEAVAFARRPGRFAVVLNCVSGAEIARLDSPEGRHFYGHGAFTADGRYLLTTENAYDDPDGRLGVWDVQAGYVRIDDLPSGGIGPHEIIRLSAGGFAVANGGIQTHPDLARARLNLPTMRTNLTWLDAGGAIISASEGPMRLNSIRHIDADASGRVVAALQWQGDPREAVPLLAEITPTQFRYLEHPETALLKQYAGSIALSDDGARIAMTGPKGGHVLFFDGLSGAPDGGAAVPLASGVVADETGFTITCADGLWHSGGSVQPVPGGWVFDNHLVRIGAGAV